MGSMLTKVKQTSNIEKCRCQFVEQKTKTAHATAQKVLSQAQAHIIILEVQLYGTH